jgi:hypothetical protein
MRRSLALVAIAFAANRSRATIHAEEQELPPFDLEAAFQSVNWESVRDAVKQGAPISKQDIKSFPKNPYCEFCMSNCGDQYIEFVLACELEKRDNMEPGAACHPYFKGFADCIMSDPEYRHYFDKPAAAEGEPSGALSEKEKAEEQSD